MGTALTGLEIKDTYDGLVKTTDNGPLSGTAKYLSDGLGNDSVLALSTTAVGVSETSPLGKLHVKTADTGVSSVSAQGNLLVLEDTENGLSILSSTAGAGYILFGDSADNDVAGIIYDHSANAMIFNTNAAERLRITSAGNVGIGTSAPAYKLQINASGGNGISLLGDVDNEASVLFGDSGSAVIGRLTYSNIDDSMRIFTNGSEKVRILSSGGITFNGDTAAANALDDYEEGDWTPTVAFGGASVGVTYTSQVGKYTKIGRQVTVSCHLVLSAKGSSTGVATLGGLPFTIPNNLPNLSATALRIENITFANIIQGYGIINSTSVGLEEVTEAGVVTSITNADFSSTSGVILGFSYSV